LGTGRGRQARSRHIATYTAFFALGSKFLKERKKLMYKSTNKSGWLNSTKTKARVIFNGYGRETFSSVFNIVTLCTLGLLFA
jgi:hypothetical protein